MTLQETTETDSIAPELPRLESAEVRKHLSGPSMKAFIRMMDEWDASVAIRCAVLGNVPRSTYQRWAAKGARELSRDQLERISVVLGIYKGLKLLFSDEAGGIRWFKAGNADYAFDGLSPIQRMANGSITDLYSVRAYIDAMRGGR